MPATSAVLDPVLICTEIFGDKAHTLLNFPILCETAKMDGYSGLEIAPFSLGTDINRIPYSERLARRKIAEAAGVPIDVLHWLLAKTDAHGFNVTSPDLEVRRRTANYIVDLGQLCSDLGGRLMVFGSPKQREFSKGVTLEEATGFAVDTFSRALDRLATLEVKLLIEPLWTNETNWINSNAQGRGLVRRINHPAFGFHFDTKQAWYEAEATGTTIEALALEHAGDADHIHISDPDLKGPGEGKIYFPPVIKALKTANPKARRSVEIFDFKYKPVAEISKGCITNYRLLEAA